MIHINYNKRNINIISFIVSIIIFILIIYILHILSQNKLNQFSYINIISKNIIDIETQEVIENQIRNEESENKKENQDIELEKIYKWKVEIEKLNIKANIQEGINEEILSKSVGHAEKSNILNGIVVLKAYNTGKEINHFANLKELIIGDKIKYIINEEERIYKVVENIILDKEKIENKIRNIKSEKENNFLILLTYVKDMENKNRLVVAKK